MKTVVPQATYCWKTYGDHNVVEALHRGILWNLTWWYMLTVLNVKFNMLEHFTCHSGACMLS